MKKTTFIIILSAFSCRLFSQDSVYNIYFNPSVNSFNAPETKIFSIPENEYNVHKQKVIKIKTVDYKEYTKKSDSIKKIFKIKCPYIFLNNGCLHLETYQKNIDSICPNTNPIDDKQYLNFYFIGIDNRFGVIYRAMYECSHFYILNLKSRICYPLTDLCTTESGEILYGFDDYISYGIYIYDMKNNTDVILGWGGNPFGYIKEFYLFNDKSLRIKFSNNYNDKNYKYINIQFRK